MMEMYEIVIVKVQIESQGLLMDQSLLAATRSSAGEESKETSKQHRPPSVLKILFLHDSLMHAKHGAQYEMLVSKFGGVLQLQFMPDAGQ